MSIISIEVIHSHDPDEFKKMVNAFLDKNEEMVFHDKTVYGVTTKGRVVLELEGFEDFAGALHDTVYSAIFQLEGAIKLWR
jgi:hypothetical protein